MKYLIICLAISGPLIAIIYSTLNQFGIIDKWTKHVYTVKALSRLEKVTGYPESWIYNDLTDQKDFNAIFRIIKKHTKEEKIIKTLNEGHKPTMLTVGGDPIPIQGIPNNWTQEERFQYTDNHPIILTFYIQRNGNSKGKGDKVCTLGELRNWVKEEKQKYDYIVGGVVIGLIGIAIALWQLKFSSK